MKDSQLVPSSQDTVKKGLEVVMARGQERLDISDLRLFNFLLQKTYTKLNDRTIHQLPVRDALNFLGHTSLQRLESSLRVLGEVKLEIDYVQDGVDHTASCHFLSFDFSKTENGMIRFAFDQILLRFLWEPKVYARINIHFLRKFKSSYGARLYEMMAFYVHRFHRTMSLSVEEVRTLLGVPETSYARFDNLKRAVIDKSVDEVNSIAPFGVAVEYVRGGRGGKVVEVKFSIVEREEVADIPTDWGISGKRVSRDPHTVDFVDGQTDEERGSHLVISTQTIDEARSILEDAGEKPDDATPLIEEWRETIKGHAISDPNLSFLRWLKMRVQADENDLMGDIEDDVFGSILAEFE